VYDLKSKTLNGQPITSFEVRFAVPMKGLFTNIDDAIDAAASMDLEAETVIPCSVAVNRLGEYEVLR